MITPLGLLAALLLVAMIGWRLIRIVWRLVEDREDYDEQRERDALEGLNPWALR